MPSKLVHVELDETGLPCRIFRNKDWRKLPDDQTTTMVKSQAVGAIRSRIYERSRSLVGAGCERCGRHITWDSMEMNEIIPKGSGGEVSLTNCEALCHNCHQVGPDSAHGDRRWQTSKLSPEGQNGH